MSVVPRGGCSFIGRRGFEKPFGCTTACTSLSRVPWRHTRSPCYTGVRPCRTISSSVCPDPNLVNVPFLSVKCLAEKRVLEGLGRHSPRRESRSMLPSQLACLAHLQILVVGLAPCIHLLVCQISNWKVSTEALCNELTIDHEASD